MRKLLYIIIGTMLLSCSERKEYVEALDRAKAILHDYPDSALTILNRLGIHEEEFSKHLKMQYRLHRMNTYNKLDTVFHSTKEAQDIADYFEDHGTPNEQMLAYYLLGRTYYDTHEAPMALRYFQIASEKADTTSDDCDYRQLSRVYGQMGIVFYQQNLIEESLKSGEISIKYGWKGKDTLNALLGMGGQICTYERALKNDTAIIVCENVVSLLKKNRYRRLAAAFLGSIVRVLIESGQKEKAKEYMNIYEAESGYFDNNGNIEKGREIYYYSKGLYYLTTQQYDSAEYYFRKELINGKDFNNQNAASRGLALLFQQKHMGDSAAKYALYSYEMNDSVYANMATKEIEQMQSMYDYSRNQEIARLAKEESERNYSRLKTITLLLFVFVITVFYAARRIYIKQKESKRRYEENVSALASTQDAVIKLRSYGDELSQMLAEKEEQANRLIAEIEAYKEKAGQQKMSTEVMLLNSKEYDNLKIIAARGTLLSDDDWHKVYIMIIETMPTFNKFISSNKHQLNNKEYKTCILIRLHFIQKEIANMIGVSPAYIAKISNRVMQKLFDASGKTKDLENRLKQFS